MNQPISQVLDVSRQPRQSHSLKADRTLHRVTFNPSSASPGETLYISVPKLSANTVLVPGSFGLLATLKIDVVSSSSTDANRYVINNLARNLVVRKKVMYGGETIEDTNRIDLYKTYSDLFKTVSERDNMLREGVSSETYRKIRAAAGDKSTDTKEVKLAGTYGNRYRIPLDHDIIDSHGVFYPRSLENTLSFEITLADSKDIIFYVADKPYKYTLTNLELEYECINSASMANEAAAAYNTGKQFFYNNVLLHKQFEYDDKTDTVINEHVNIPRRSMSGILCLFVKKHVAGARDTEKFTNPDIEAVNVNIDGMPNKLVSKGLIPSDFYDVMTRRMGSYDSMTAKAFYNDHFGLWVDLRTYPDNELHGSGLSLSNTKDGVKLEIRRKAASTSAKTLCLIYVVADGVVEIQDSNLKSIIY